jgi:hypothetical protein
MTTNIAIIAPEDNGPEVGRRLFGGQYAVCGMIASAGMTPSRPAR